MMNTCARCGEPYTPATEAHLIENLCNNCLFDPKRTEFACPS